MPFFFGPRNMIITQNNFLQHFSFLSWQTFHFIWLKQQNITTRRKNSSAMTSHFFVSSVILLLFRPDLWHLYVVRTIFYLLLWNHWYLVLKQQSRFLASWEYLYRPFFTYSQILLDKSNSKSTSPNYRDKTGIWTGLLPQREN